VQSTNDVSFAFNQLLAAVRELNDRRGQCLGAPLKIELKRRSYGTFNEAKLGFPRFGDFLRAAETAGYIRVQPTPGGDLLVTPISASSDDTSKNSSLPPRTVQPLERPGAAPWESGFRWQAAAPVAWAGRVRQDLWNAFNNVYDEWVYDRSQDLAMRKSASRTGSPGDLVPIPNGRQLLIEWVRAFADTQQQGTKEFVSGLLEAPDAPLNFLSAVRSDRLLYRSWHGFHVQCVLKQISSWASTHDLNVRNLFTPGQERVLAPAGVREARLKVRPEGRPFSPGAPSGAPVGAADDDNPKAVLIARLGETIDDVVERLITLRGLIALSSRRS
jgi:hypothetical protein